MACIASCSIYVDDAILLFDEQFRLVDFNERALQVCGYSREELDATAPSVQGRISSTPPVCDPNGTPSRGEGS